MCGRETIDDNKMTLADEIRDFAFEKFIRPSSESGEKTVTVRAGDVHEAMDLKGKIPSVCGALGTKKFLTEHNLRLVNREGPSCGANVFFTYEML